MDSTHISQQGSDQAQDSTPVISVAVPAYNQASYLPKALDSILAQRTAFPIEIVVSDDCSKDNTVEVARSYQQRFPNMVRVLSREKNVGMQRNYYELFESCRGRLIAWLDADDYWTDPGKLEIQATLLENDPSVSACAHLVRWVSHEGEVNRERYPTIAAGRYGLPEVLRHDFLPSLSVMFRNGIHRGLPPWYFDHGTTDWPIWVLAALSGDIVLLDRIMADYVLMPGSQYMSKGPLHWYRTDAQFYDDIESVLPVQWHGLVRAEKGKRYEALAYALRKQGDYAGSRQAAVKAFRSPALFDNVGSKTKALLAATVREAQWKLGGSSKPTE